MKNLSSDILDTAQLDVLALVKQHCPACSQVIIPPGADSEPDIYRCKAAAGKHCVVAINTSQCIREVGPDDEPPVKRATTPAGRPNTQGSDT